MSDKISSTLGARGFIDFALRASVLSLPFILAISAPGIDGLLKEIALQQGFHHHWFYAFVFLAANFYFVCRLLWEYGHEWRKLSDELDLTSPTDSTEKLTEIALRYAESTNDATRAFVIFLLGAVVATRSVLQEEYSLPLILAIIFSIALLGQAFILQTSLSFGDAFIDKVYLISRKANAGVAREWEELRTEISRKRETDHFRDKDHWPNLYRRSHSLFAEGLVGRLAGGIRSTTRTAATAYGPGSRGE